MTAWELSPKNYDTYKLPLWLPEEPIFHNHVMIDKYIHPPTTLARLYQGLYLKQCLHLSCDELSVCDLDTNRCLPLHMVTKDDIFYFHDKALTGSGQRLIEYLLSIGYSFDDLIKNQDKFSANMKRYLQLAIITREKFKLEFPVYFTNIMKIGNTTISTKGWPKGLTMIPDFLTPLQGNNVRFSLNDDEWVNNQQIVNKNIWMFQTQNFELPDKPPPAILDCLAYFFVNHNFIPSYPQQFRVTKYDPKEGNHIIDDKKLSPIILMLCLGSSFTIKFIKKDRYVKVPVLSGSLLILQDEARYDYSRKIEPIINEEYEVPNLPVQQWQRYTFITIVFR